MNQDILKHLAAAGLLHDLGKFAERAGATRTNDPDEVRQEYGYGHADGTAQVLEGLWQTEVFRQVDGGQPEDNLFNMAARHHKPRRSLEVIVSEADRLASGHERARADEAARADETTGRFRRSQIPLHAIMERVRLELVDERGAETVLRECDVLSKRYRLKPLQFGQEANGFRRDAFFPVDREEYPPEKVEADYKGLWTGFKAEAERITNPVAELETLQFLLRKYAWCLPASTRYDELPDVSLFEHLRVTAALAVCLGAFHSDSTDVPEAVIRNRQEDKYVLFCGDIGGIQRFIYNISSKGAYKSLKGRSFYLQVLSEVLARYFLEECGVPPTNLLYASGGKFYLLLPNTPGQDAHLSELSDKVNGLLFERFRELIFLRTGWEPISGEDLCRREGRTLCDIWDDLTRKVVLSDRTRYARLASRHYGRFFSPWGHGGEVGKCDVCQEELAADETERKCRQCRDMEKVGAVLRNARWVVYARHQHGGLEFRPHLDILKRRIWVLSDLPKSLPEGSLVLAINSTDLQEAWDVAPQGTGVQLGSVMLGGNHSFDREFDDIARAARGPSRLGIMRMDVDNLGQIFSNGLKRYKYGEDRQAERLFADAEQARRFNFHSLGRITTLSFHLSYYFGALVQDLIEQRSDWKNRAVIVYAGGDDLFLVGAWDTLPEISLEINRTFRQFTCGNPAFTVSGGMVLTGGKFPIYKSAEMAGEAEDGAKNISLPRYNGNVQVKDSFTLLDEPMTWAEFTCLSQKKDELCRFVEETGKRALLGRLRGISESFQLSRRVLEWGGGITSNEELMKQLNAERWRWQMVYSLHRFAEGEQQLMGMMDRMQQFIMSNIPGSPRRGIELLHVLARWVELFTRSDI
jgi:CRISPR-associated protein Csm1